MSSKKVNSGGQKKRKRMAAQKNPGVKAILHSDVTGLLICQKISLNTWGEMRVSGGGGCKSSIASGLEQPGQGSEHGAEDEPVQKGRNIMMRVMSEPVTQWEAEHK